MQRVFPLRWLVLLLALAANLASQAATPASQKLLLVVAHPDDELLVAATLYRLGKEVGATIDQVVITNGEGGYRYATLAEKVYGIELTDEEVARRELPAIRQREALAAGRILGIRNHHFLGEPDRDNTDNPEDVLHATWNVARILDGLVDLIASERYDFVIVGLPRKDIGGHHGAATLLALRAVARLDRDMRPVMLGSWFSPEPFSATTDEAAGFSGDPDFVFDREYKFGFNDKLDYQVVVNWVIAEHKSQGLYQKNMGRWRHECFWVSDRASQDVMARAEALFAQIAPPGP